jgi:hypothetical protein
MTTVITYQSPSSLTIDLTPAQVAALGKAGKWPRDWSGQEYCTVSHGRHAGSPTYTDAKLAKEIGVESL